VKRIFKIILILVIGLVCGLLLGLITTVPRKVGISEIQVSKQKIGDEEVLIIDSPEHPPWAQQHITSVEFDYNKKTISIIRYFVIFHPLFQHEIYSRWPIILSGGVLPGEYKLQIWQRGHYEIVGTVIAGDTNVNFQPIK
jgi:hypothetical protein